MNYRQIVGGATALLLIVTMVKPVSAQSAGRWATTWSYSTVLGVKDTKDFADGFSWRGVSLDVNKGLTDDFTVGGTIGWHVLSENGSGTGEFDAGAISGTAFRYVNSMPLLATGHYYIGQ